MSIEPIRDDDPCPTRQCHSLLTPLFGPIFTTNRSSKEGEEIVKKLLKYKASGAPASQLESFANSNTVREHLEDLLENSDELAEIYGDEILEDLLMDVTTGKISFHTITPRYNVPS